MVHELKDKVVLVTGGANGIGAAIIKALIVEDVKVIVSLDVDEQKGLALQEELNSRTAQPLVQFIKCDVTKEDQICEAFKSVVAKHGYIDVVINNAGMCNDTMETHRKAIEINYMAVVTSSLRALELMRKDEGGRGGTIVNVGSIASLVPFPNWPAYCGAKAGVVMFSICIGMPEYYTRTGVRTLAVCFGATKTDLVDHATTFDKLLQSQYAELMKNLNVQPVEAAAQGLLEAYKKGESASTWLVSDGNARDITGEQNRATAILAELI